MDDMSAEEGDVARLHDGGYLAPSIFLRDARERVDLVVGVADVLDGFQVGKRVAVISSSVVGRRVDRLVLRTDGEPETAILFIGPIDRQPGSTESIRDGRDIVRILVVALTVSSRRLDKEHRLHRHDVRANQRFEDVEDAWMQQEPLVDLEHAMEHVNTQVATLDLEDRRAGRRWLKTGNVAATIDQIVDVSAQV